MSKTFSFDVFTSFFRYVVPKPRAECTKGEQLVVTFAAGYIAGVFCAIVSHPADTVVSKLNQDKGATAGDVVKKLGFAGKQCLQAIQYTSCHSHSTNKLYTIIVFMLSVLNICHTSPLSYIDKFQFHCSYNK